MKRLRLQNSRQLASNHCMLLTPTSKSGTFPPQSPLALASLQGTQCRLHFFLPDSHSHSRFFETGHSPSLAHFLSLPPPTDANTLAPYGHVNDLLWPNSPTCLMTLKDDQHCKMGLTNKQGPFWRCQTLMRGERFTA